MEVSAAKRGKSSRGLGDTYVKAISTAAVAKKEGAIQGGVRKWNMYKTLPSFPVATDKFAEHVERVDEMVLTPHYDECKTVNEDAPQLIGEGYPRLNRYINVVPYDHSVVLLQKESAGPITPADKEREAPEYVNASYMPGENSLKEYIATQGPMRITYLAFWSMIWQTKATVIVMLTKVKEPDNEGKLIPKCSQYWPNRTNPSGLKLTKAFKVTNEGEDRMGSYIIRTFKVVQEEEELMVKQYHFTAWPDHGVPSDYEELLSFVRVSREAAKKNEHNGPLVVHCSAGAGRTG
ncbi:receptor-type tyrosine-protein phosphatase H-like isoform X2 [Convolutriloba macropyga]|uniref:receptor-type tyrosine-protein phosphatase H-like isoform X2 n=1 Tax=Convolutriloba macropyga TaxID=536237 RepID=UPI003F526A9B